MAKIQEQEDETDIIQANSKRLINTFNSEFQEVLTDFSSVDSRLGMVANTAIRIGEQLETLDKNRTKAFEASEMIEFFNCFNQNNPKPLNDLLNAGKEFRVALICKRLATLSKEVDLPGSEHVFFFYKAQKNIQSFNQEFEKELIRRFNMGYVEKNISEMNV